MALTYSLSPQVGFAVQAHQEATGHGAWLVRFGEGECRDCAWKAHEAVAGNPYGINEFGAYILCVENPDSECGFGDEDYHDRAESEMKRLRAEYARL